MKKIAWIPLLALLFASCTKGVNERYLILKFSFSDTLPRLNDTGAVAILPVNHAALTPLMNAISANYVELTKTATDSAGFGTIVYRGEDHFKDITHFGIDYSQSYKVKEGEAFVAVPLSSIKPGIYQYLRIGIGYQNFDVPYGLDTVINSWKDSVTGISYPGASFSGLYNGTVSGFTGYATFFDEGFTIKSKKVRLDSIFKQQGFWGFETVLGTNGYNYPAITTTGTAPFTTEVNPIYKTSPLPKGAGIITAAINGLKYSKAGVPTVYMYPLVITGAETESIIVECKMSIKNSFEWQDDGIRKGVWEPLRGEQVIDMGLRNMQPIIIK